MKTYFDERFENLPAANKSYRWVELHCEAAEMIAPFDQQKAQAYLAQAEKETNDNLWAYFFSFNRTGIEQKRQEALSRIAEAKAKIKP